MPTENDPAPDPADPPAPASPPASSGPTEQQIRGYVREELANYFADTFGPKKPDAPAAPRTDKEMEELVEAKVKEAMSVIAGTENEPPPPPGPDPTPKPEAKPEGALSWWDKARIAVWGEA